MFTNAIFLHRAAAQADDLRNRVVPVDPERSIHDEEVEVFRTGLNRIDPRFDEAREATRAATERWYEQCRATQQRGSTAP